MHAADLTTKYPASPAAARTILCVLQVTALQADSPEAHANLASSYKDAARHDVAIVSYRHALTLRQDFPEAFANLVHSLQCVCEWAERPAMFKVSGGSVAARACDRLTYCN